MPGAATLLVLAGLAVSRPGLATGSFEDHAELRLVADKDGDVVVLLALERDPPDGRSLCDALDRLLPVRLDRVSRFNRDSKLYGIGRGALGRDRFRVSGAVDFAPLATALADQGFDALTVEVREPPSARPGRPPEPVQFSQVRQGSIALTFATAHPPARWPWSAGFTRRDVARIGWALASLMLLPFALLLAIRAWALADRTADPAALWFRHARQSGAIVLCGLIGWPVAMQALGASRLAEWLWPMSLSFLHPAFIAWLYTGPPALILLVATVLGHRVSVRARGEEWSLRETVLQTVLQLATIVTPVTLVALAIVPMARGQFLPALVLVAVAFASALLLSRLHRRAVDLTPHALTTGPLRDRLFELASRAKVRLQQIYVLPMRRARLANAFAVRGGIVMLTDVLLENLSRHEVDAVMAHEIAHLQHQHPRKLALAAMVIVVLIAVGLNVDTVRPAWPWIGAALIAALAGLFALYRRFERVADAGAVTLGADPEALIGALGRLGRLNRIPHEWGRWSGAFLTHPSTGWRVRALGRAAGLSEARVAELLGDAPRDTGHYEMPATLANGKVFSTSFKLQSGVRIGWLLIAVAALMPALIVAAARANHLMANFGWAVALIGPVLTFAVMLTAVDTAAMQPFRALHRRFRERLRGEGLDPERLGGVFVGLAPGEELRVYEGFFDWDIAYLFLLRDRLVYLGEEARFALTRADVHEITLGPGAPGWIPTARIYVRWATANGDSGTFQLRPADARSLSGSRAAARQLLDGLVAWQRDVAPSTGEAGAASGHAALPPLGPPRIGDVTSISARALASARGAVLGCVLTAVPAAILSMTIAGGGLATLYAVGVACLAQLALFVPYWRARSAAPRRAEASVRRAA